MYKFMNLWKLGVYYAPDAGGAGGSEGGSEGGNGGSEGEDEDGDEGDEGDDKKFTQADVNKLLAKEKRKGKTSILKDLGLDPEDKEAVSKLKQLIESNRSDGEKKDKALKDAQDTASKEATRATKAEQKLKVLMAGCQKDFVEEVTAMALAKMDDDTDFDEALEAVKKKMPNCFGESEEDQDKGTGRSQGHKKQKSKPGSFGESLAAGISTNISNPYFKN